MINRLVFAVCLTFVVFVATPELINAQSNTRPRPTQTNLARQYEFVQSSSPMGRGRTVTRTVFTDNRRSELSISAPPVQRVTNLPPYSPRTAFQQPAANTVPALGTPPAQLPNAGAIAPFPNPNCAPNRNYYGQVYPYPVNNVPPTFGPTFANGPQPLIRLRTLPRNAYVGQGIIGQPTAYVPGEPLRNIIRYIMP